MKICHYTQICHNCMYALSHFNLSWILHAVSLCCIVAIFDDHVMCLFNIDANAILAINNNANQYHLLLFLDQDFQLSGSNENQSNLLVWSLKFIHQLFDCQLKPKILLWLWWWLSCITLQQRKEFSHNIYLQVRWCWRNNQANSISMSNILQIQYNRNKIYSK